MADTWVTAQGELEKLLDDVSFESGGSNNTYLLTWANRVIKDIHLEIDIRDHIETEDIAITGGAYNFNLPDFISDYWKISSRFTRFRVDDNWIPIVGLDTLDEYDSDHTSTTSGDPTCVAIEGNYLYVYPLVTCTGTLMNYFRMPTDMTATSSAPDLPWVYYVTDLIVAGVAGRYAFPWLNEYEQSNYWNKRYKELLEKYRLHVGKSNSMKEVEAKYY